jgi:hypothetical protein
MSLNHPSMDLLSADIKKLLLALDLLQMQYNKEGSGMQSRYEYSDLK